LRHTGGINAHTIPGLLAGAYINIIEPHWLMLSKIINNLEITHIHITPRISCFLEKIRNFNVNLEVVMCGSDCVTKSSVEFWIKRSKKFIINYGLTEAGPIIINHTFDINSDLSIFDKGTPLGTKCWVEYKIENRELFLRGSTIHKNGWLATDDCVDIDSNWFIYKGRKSAGCKIIPKRY
jgi:long-subunit acyl-CoA synthetase (AMP-forming)